MSEAEVRLCDACRDQPATNKVEADTTNRTDKKTFVMHLCDNCAREHREFLRWVERRNNNA